MKSRYRAYMMLPVCLFLFFAVCTMQTRAEEKESTTSEKTESESVERPFLRPFNADENKSWATLGRLYVIVATDDLLDGLAGKVAKSNGDIVEKMFRQNLANGAYAVIRIPGDKLTRQVIFSTVSNLPIKSQDAVCLYFSGKGGYDRRKGSCFELSRGKEELYRSELRNALVKKGCRLDVLISDFCDGYSLPMKPQPKEEASDKTDEDGETTAKKDEKPDEKSDEKKEVKSNENKDEKKGNEAKLISPENDPIVTPPFMFSLFFQTYGSVDIIGATLPMQQSLPTWQGIGCFTETLDTLLRTNRNKYLSWYRFFPYLANGTGLLFKENYPEGAILSGGLKQSLQTPMLLTLGQDNYNPNVFADCYPQGKDFSRPVPGVSEDEIPLSDEDRRFIADAVRQSFDTIRPQNDQDKGTHEDYASLDPDNTVNGFDGEPFSMVLPSLKLINSEQVGNEKKEDSDVAASTAPSSSTTSTPKNKKPRFGVAAAANDSDGVRITHVIDELPGKRHGLEVGDVILKIDGKQITSEKEYSDAVDAAGEIMVLEVRNAKGGNIVTLRVRMRSAK